MMVADIKVSVNNDATNTKDYVFESQIDTRSDEVTQNTYRDRDLFSSGYQVIKPIGLLTSKGIMSVHRGSAICEDSYEATEIYNYLCGRLGFEESDSRQFDRNLIVEHFLGGESKKLYFPQKLLEYTFGCSEGNGDKYSFSSEAKSWESYESGVALPQIEDICKSVLIVLFKVSGYLEDDSYKKHFDLLTGIVVWMVCTIRLG